MQRFQQQQNCKSNIIYGFFCQESNTFHQFDSYEIYKNTINQWQQRQRLNKHFQSRNQSKNIQQIIQSKKNQNQVQQDFSDFLYLIRQIEEKNYSISQQLIMIEEF